MSGLEDCFFFVLYPKTLIIKGIYYNSKLPHFSVSIYRGSTRQDHTTIVPVREQKLYHTYFLLQTGKLQFTEMSDLHSCHQRRVAIYDKDKLVGDFTLPTDEYVSNYHDYNSNCYQEKVKLTDTIEFEFELYLAPTRSQLSEVVIEYRGESEIRTPLTSHLINQQSADSIMRNVKASESELYSPTLSVPKKQKEDIDQQSSVNSSVPLSSPPMLKSTFMISLKAVPVKSSSSVTTTPPKRSLLAEQLQEFTSLPLKDKLIFTAFALVSITTIYLSMLPIKKI